MLEDKLRPIFDEIILNSQEIERMKLHRNELLPLLMNGQVSIMPPAVNCDLVYFANVNMLSFNSPFIMKELYDRIMKEQIINGIITKMGMLLTEQQLEKLQEVLEIELYDYKITVSMTQEHQANRQNEELLASFISAKRIEGCSSKTLVYYESTIKQLLATITVKVDNMTTNDIRCYLSNFQSKNHSSKVTVDNVRRILSSFFSWLEDEDYILKSPVRRIHKVRSEITVKEVISDEQLEKLRDTCSQPRDLAMIDFLVSTGVRVGELVRIERKDIDLQERQCIVLGKGNKERTVYFNARTKVHLERYLTTRTDDNPALFVSLTRPHNRLTISGVELRMRELGKRANICHIHPHKFRRTLATMAIDRGMPIEQVQRLLGHCKIDTTLHYAMVNQNNVKIAHRKFIS